MSELAIVSSRKTRLAARASEGDRGAAVALALAEDPGRFLPAVQIGITLVGILAGAYSGATLAEPLAATLADIPALAGAAEGLAIALVVGAITYASLILGELVPKHVALADPERVACLVSRPMAGLALAASPLVWLLERSSRLVLALLRVRKQDGQAVTEDDVRALIAEGALAGVFHPREKEMLSGVMRFGDRKIKGIMTPRGDAVWLDLNWDAERLREVIRTSPHSRFPVCRGGFDEMVGVVQAKDLVDRWLDGGDFDVAAAMRPVEMIHDNAPALTVLDMLKRSPIHMAVVIDEYGSVEGIVTAADILSAILGGLSEHGEEYEATATRREDGSWLLDGELPADVAAERLGLRHLEQDADYSTVAGFVLARLRAIPTAGDHFEWKGWRFEVVDMDGRRVDKVLASRAALSSRNG
ncbi:MAG: HlyC/CorC family transporter [Alphaproteobacteria bacterium]|nr:HlyC/CorC family transporter [Alphaproteobacteria bacterium]